MQNHQLFDGDVIRVELDGTGIAELCFDRRDGKINKFDNRTGEELRSAVAALRSAPGLHGVLVTSAKNDFIVGADIFEFAALFAQTSQQIAQQIARYNDVFTAFEDLPVPSVAAINGLALGAGFEFAMTSDLRILAESAQIGLPEVTLGIIPGLGGTVRLPRISSLTTALEWIATGKPQSASRALSAGVADAVASSEALCQTARDRLWSLIGSQDWRAIRLRKNASLVAQAAAFAQCRAALSKVTVHEPAALLAVEVIETGCALPRDRALQVEHRAFVRNAHSQAASGLVQIFINEQFIARKTKSHEVRARKVAQSAVVGAGIMGRGIAVVAALHGTSVLMTDIAEAALVRGMAEARNDLDKKVSSGNVTREWAESRLALIRPVRDYAGFESVDFVIEAVAEDMTIKKIVLADIERCVTPDTVIASNTSSLSIGEMAGVLARPENLVGMHFFNPVPAMALVEVVRGSTTSREATATAVAFARSMGKTPIMVNECPGFLVNRILTPYMLGFLRAVHDGADYLAIDAAMEKFGWPMGPSFLADVAGLDTLMKALNIITAGFPDRMLVTVPHAVEIMVDHQRFGRKNGVGFYAYEPDARGRLRKIIDPKTASLLDQVQPGGRREIAEEELVERLMLPMIIESMRCLEEGIVESAAEVDMALVLGLGFPRYTGGPLKYADWLGVGHMIGRCDKYAYLGPLYQPTTGMRDAARNGRHFY